MLEPVTMPPEPAPVPDAHADFAQLALDLGAARDLATVYRRLYRFVAEQTPPICGMFVSSYDPATELRACVFANSENEELDPATFPPMPNTGSPHSRAVVTGETIVTQDFQEAMSGKPRMNVGLERDARLPQSSIVVPMKAHDRILGAMEIQSTKPAAFTPTHVSILQMAAHLAALAVSNVQALEREKRSRAEVEVRAAILEEKVQARVRELAAKNRELEAFSFTVAHDLRAPLRAVLNLSEDVLKRHSAALPEPARADLEAIHSSSVRMAHLVDDLLKFARTAQGSVARELVDMTSMARSLVNEYAAREPHRKVDVRIQENLYAEADGALVRILLDNLLGNAWKYTSRKDETVIRMGAFLEQGEIVFFVEDEGIGFDPAQASRLFAAFARLHPGNEYEGTGIGLATAQRIVQRHGGRIWATGVPGKGARFCFTLKPAPGATP